MSEPIDDSLLRALWRGADEETARKLYETFVDRLVALARKRLSQRLASRVDPEDIVQSVFRTFFVRLKEGQFHIHDRDDLCKLLARITVHKTLRQVAYHRAVKRDPRKEAGQDEEARTRVLEVLDREPGPEEVVAFEEEMQTFLSKLTLVERRILEMRMQGYSNEEIGKELGIYDRKIRRLIERVRGLAIQEGLAPLEYTREG